MKRVCCLYRVSIKKQVEKDDIPMQRIACHSFVDSKEDWNVVKEFYEKGVSGFKTATKDRDAIQEIRKAAEKKEFDILLVFMFDRLGRREDETPFLVEWFVRHGIEVWSAQEGQQKIETRSDKLINYIRYWQAGGESEKTSERVKVKHRQMVEDGQWRGGTCPFGYKLVHKGRTGRKNRPLLDLAINDEEASIVSEIYHLNTVDGIGSFRISKVLNSKYEHLGKVWNARSVNTILKNPLYTGIMRCSEVVSPPQEHLRIISDNEFAFAQRVMADRITRKYNYAPGEATLMQTHGASLLSGLLYCAHCGHKLVGNYTSREYASGRKYKQIYRCYHRASHPESCSGQSTYTANRIETAVLDTVHLYFSNFTKNLDSVWYEQAKLQTTRKQSDELKLLRAQATRLEIQRTKLKEEVLKSIIGDSSFDTKLLNDMLIENQVTLDRLNVNITTIEVDLKASDQRTQALGEIYLAIKQLAKRFDASSADQKKMIMAQIIERITVNRNYKVSIKFYLLKEDFDLSEIDSEKIEVIEAKINKMGQVS